MRQIQENKDRNPTSAVTSSIHGPARPDPGEQGSKLSGSVAGDVEAVDGRDPGEQGSKLRRHRQPSELAPVRQIQENKDRNSLHVARPLVEGPLRQIQENKDRNVSIPTADHHAHAVEADPGEQGSKPSAASGTCSMDLAVEADPGEQGSKHATPYAMAGRRLPVRQIQENKDRNSLTGRRRRQSAGEADPGEQGSKPKQQPGGHRTPTPLRQIQENKDRNIVDGPTPRRPITPAEADPGEQGSKLFRRGRRPWRAVTGRRSRRTRIETLVADRPAAGRRRRQIQENKDRNPCTAAHPQSRRRQIQENKDRNYRSRGRPTPDGPEADPGEQGSKPLQARLPGSRRR